MHRLARYARPILLVTAALLTVGAMLTVFGMPLVGWTIYGVGYLGLLVALPAIVAVNRSKMDGWSWLTFGVLYVGIVLGVPVMLMVLGHYAQNPAVHDALMPYAILPIGMFAGIIAWVGLLLFGLATWRAEVLPTGAAVMFVIAGAVALPAELGLLTAFFWAFAILLASFGLVWVATSVPESRGVPEAI